MPYAIICTCCYIAQMCFNKQRHPLLYVCIHCMCTMNLPGKSFSRVSKNCMYHGEHNSFFSSLCYHFFWFVLRLLHILLIAFVMMVFSSFRLKISFGSVSYMWETLVEWIERYTCTHTKYYGIFLFVSIFGGSERMLFFHSFE